MQESLRKLQSGQPLDGVAPAFAPVALSKPPLQDVLAAELAGVQHETVRKVVGMAEFWIGLLEGERADLLEEISRQRQANMETKRQAESQVITIRELEAEKRRLLSELENLQKARDEAIMDRLAIQEKTSGRSSMPKDDVEALLQRAKTLETDLGHERQERVKFETQLVHSKLTCAEALEEVDNLKVVTRYYEDQLRSLVPSFVPADADALGNLRHMGPGAAGEPDASVPLGGATDTGANNTEQAESKEKKVAKLRGGFSQMRRMFKPDKKHKGQSGEAEASGENAATSDSPSPSNSLFTSPRGQSAKTSPFAAAAPAATPRTDEPAPAAPEEQIPPESARSGVPSGGETSTSSRKPKRWELRSER